ARPVWTVSVRLLHRLTDRTGLADALRPRLNRMRFASDAELFTTIRKELYTAVVGDVLDQMGHRVHFLPPAIRPLRPDMVVVGRAAPAVVGDAQGTPGDRFGRLLQALDSLREGDVYITTGGKT